MSRRTSEASKAIRAAWINEKELVAEGKGTRDWTPDQQKEILEFGKAYYHSDDPDDVNDGKAFEGHHMKSAEAYPEYQGDAGNIQFLSRPEHQEAHGGDYRNTTNGYFDPVTNVTRDFGDNIYEPCPVIELSEPMHVVYSDLGDEKKDIAEPDGEDTNITELKSDDSEPKIEENIKASADTSPRARVSTTVKAPAKSGGGFIEAIKGFATRHPVLTGLVITAATTGVKIVVDAISDALTDNGHSGTSKNNGVDYHPSSKSDDDYSNDLYLDTDIEPDQRDYLDERSSPEEHIVKDHGQHYHTKGGIIWKEKEPYHRGGKHDDD